MRKKRVAAFLALCAWFCVCVSVRGEANILEITIDGIVVQEKVTSATQDVIDKAVNFAKGIAEDNSHGYNNSGHGWGPEYNCIGLVMTAYTEAGYPLGQVNINKMPERLLSYGFVDVTGQVDLGSGAGLVKGDILWLLYEGGAHGHTELYAGDGLLIGARGDTDGQSGDSDGDEIVVAGYSNMGWQRVFRLPEGTVSEPIVIEEPDIVISEAEQTFVIPDVMDAAMSVCRAWFLRLFCYQM